VCARPGLGALCLVAALALAGCATGAPEAGGGRLDAGADGGSAARTAGGAGAETRLRLAQRAEAQGNLDAAYAIYAKASADHPEVAAAHLGHARTAYARGQLTEAVEAYRQALRHGADGPEARYGLGRALLAIDRPLAGLEQFDRLIAKGPDDHRPFMAKGVALDLLGRHAEAAPAYRAGLERAPDSVALRNNLGLSLALSGDYMQAMRVLEGAVRDPQAGPRTRQNLALVYGLAGRSQDAMRAGSGDLPAETVERNLNYYRALRQATEARAAAPDGTADGAATGPGGAAAPNRPHAGTGSTAADTPPTGEPVRLLAAKSAPAPMGTRAAAGDEAVAEIGGGDGTRAPDPSDPAGPTQHADRAEPSDTEGADAGTADGTRPAGAERQGPASETVRTAPAAGQEAAAAPVPEREGGAYWAQLAALDSEAKARGAWDRFQRRHAEQLGQRRLALQTTEVAGKGTFFRVRTGPFADAEAARDLCRVLDARDQACVVFLGKANRPGALTAEAGPDAAR
jgi:Flp pilus assembly protein TadD